MASSKSLREAPPKILNNYIASVKKINGTAPSSILDESFISTNYISQGTTAVATDFVANNDIGFEINLNGITYTQFGVSDHGWIILQDPEANASETDIASTAEDNDTIFSTFVNNHILISPWFDSALNIVRSVDALAANVLYSGILTSKIIENIKSGKDTKNWPFNPTDRGTRFKNFYDPHNGKGLVVRWTTSQANFLNKLKFEVILFENGKIVFNYWPTETFEPGSTPGLDSTATIGIFWSGPSLGSNLFRDIAPIIGYNSNSRKINELGGSSYDSSYSESSVPYSNSISQQYWPGPATITFSPPQNPAKFLPKKLVKDIGNAKEIIRSPGLFDDRKSILFMTGSSQVVHMPSTLSSRLINDVGQQSSLINSLFTSGSIQLTGSQNRDAIEGLLQSVELEEEKRNTSDRSFNETEKNYLETSSNSEFYATGSSLEVFGLGFSDSLKSKKQIKISLPVDKTTIMPSISSSIYYYDVSLKQWTSAVPLDVSNLGPPNYGIGTAAIFGRMNEDYGIYQLAGSSGFLFNNRARITETSHGFDAVGRKIVAGANLFIQDPTTRGQRTDSFIGLMANLTDSRIDDDTNLSALEKKYPRSITDNSGSFPSGSQLISIDVEYPFVLEKLVIDIPFYMSGGWFNDKTTCNKPYTTNTPTPVFNGFTSGVVDFGGPGITFSIFSPKKFLGNSYMDLIASGTITHNFDNTASVLLYKDANMKQHMLRPVGFKCFSNPTTIVQGTWNGTGYEYTGKIHLELTPSIAGGLSFVRNDTISGTIGADTLARSKAISLLTNQQIPTLGDSTYTSLTSDTQRVYLQQISPLSRGTTGVEFNGNSPLGRNIAGFNFEKIVTNPLYLTDSGSIPGEIKSVIDSSTFSLDALMQYSTVDSYTSPYLLKPGDKLTFAISKTRPVVYSSRYLETVSNINIYGDYTLTGSHDIVQLNTGSIDVTLYGSYVREGVGYNP